MYLQQFSITDNQGNKSKGGVTVGDAIHNVGILSLIGLFFYNLWLKGTLKRGKDNIKFVDNEQKMAVSNATVRLKYITPVLKKEYGNSWEQVLYNVIKNDIKPWLLNILASQKALNEGTITIQQANDKFSSLLDGPARKYFSDLANGRKPIGHNVRTLGAWFWRHIFHAKLGFTWLDSIYNGWDKRPDGTPVMLSYSKEAELKYEQEVERITNLDYNSVVGGCLYPDDCAVVWQFDNYKRVVNDVLNEIFNEHPEYRSICSFKGF